MMPIKDINDYENTLTGQYIRAIENPDSIGYRDGKWYESNLRGYDLRNRGFGVDVKNNDAASKIVNGRDGKWLTEAEERNLRNRHIDYISGVL